MLYEITQSLVGPRITIAVPGVNILSTWNDGRVSTLSGTSMDSAEVTGAFALIKSHKPMATPAQIRDILTRMSYAPSTTTTTTTGACDDGRGYFTWDRDQICERFLQIFPSYSSQVQTTIDKSIVPAVSIPIERVRSANYDWLEQLDTLESQDQNFGFRRSIVATASLPYVIGFGGQSSIQDEPVLGFICLLDQRIIYRQTECGTLDTQRPLSSYRLERIAPGEHTFCVSL